MTTATPLCPIEGEPLGPGGVAERLFTAQHESGHAVISRLLTGFSSGGAWVEVGPGYVRGDTITPSLDCIVRRWTNVGRRFDADSPVLARIMMLSGGSEAERARYGCASGGDGSDRANIAELVPYVSEDLRDEAADLFRAAAFQMICKHRETIDRVADALAERLSLSNAEIDGMMPADWLAQAYEPCGGAPYPCQQCSVRDS